VTTDIVMPVYNGAATIAAAVSSVLAQTDSHWRLIVVDDGSTDGTRQVVQDFHDDRIVLIETDHGGVSAARNEGIANGCSRFVGFLDSDDELRPDWVSSLAPGSGVGLIRCGATIMAQGQPAEQRAASGTPLLAGMFVVLREILDAIGGYDERLSYSENTDLSYRIDDELSARGLDVDFVERPLVVIHRREDRSKRYSPAVYRSAAEVMLEKHRDRFRESPSIEANYRAIAGFNSLAMADRAQARRHLKRAVRLTPRRWRYSARLLQSYLPARLMRPR
jgi:glycosyltransferase involved in cell wall biosynthesis